MAASGALGRRRWFLGLVAVALAGVVSPIGPGRARPVEAATTASATPVTGLVDGQAVTVSGTSDDDWLLVAACASGLVGDALIDCAYSVHSVAVSPGPTADYSVEIRVPALAHGAAGPGTTDCRTASCELVVLASPTEEDEMAPVARLALGFDPTAPLLPGSDVTVSPTTDLVDGQTVQVTGSGFDAGDWPVLSQCAQDGSTATCRSLGFPTVAGDGTFDLLVRLRATLAGGGPGDARLDCRSAAVSCTLHVSGGWRDPAPVPLSFDPGAPLLDPPVLSAEPAAGLVDGQVVHITGSGLEPSSYLIVQQCGTPQGDEGVPCRSGPNSFWTVDPGGSVEGDLGVRTTFRDFSGRLVDCRTELCTLAFSSGDDDWTLPLAFDPTAPLLPPPAIAVTPSTALRDGQSVEVRLAGFDPGGATTLTVCRTGTGECDWESQRWIDLTTHSAEVQFEVFGSFDSDETRVDCRQTPGCEIRAAVDPFGSDEFVAAPITFGPPGASRGRFLDPVFDEVEVQRDVVYRTTTDYRGRTVDLKMDIYQPVGDTLDARPLLMWMHGGWFIFGSKESMDDYARASAQRGYVAVSLQYRLRPEITSADLAGVVAAARDAYDDAYAAVEWIRDHAVELGVDPRAILVGGYSAGGVLSWNLSYPEDQTEPPAGVAGAAPIAGIPFSVPRAGSPPVIGFHAVDDDTVPASGGREKCAAAVVMELVCQWVEYPDGGHGIVSSRRRDIVEKSHVFFYEQVLAGLGFSTAVGPEPSGPTPTRPEVVGPQQPSPSTTTSGPTTTTSSPVTVPVTSTTSAGSTTAPSTVSTVTPSPTTSVPAGATGDGTTGMAPGQARPASAVPGRPAYTG